jgi:hypothetical protein
MQWNLKQGKLTGSMLTSSNGNGNVRERSVRVIYNGRVLLVSLDSEAGRPKLPF